MNLDVTTTRRRFSEPQSRPANSESDPESNRFAKTLSDIFVALASKTSSEAVLDEILDQVQSLVSYSAANIMLLKDNKLHSVRWKGYDKYDAHQHFVHLQQPLAALPLDADALHRKRSILVTNTEDEANWVQFSKLNWINSFVAIPIRAGDHVLGLLRLDGDQPSQFSEADIRRLEPIAYVAAVALENARLYDQLQQELRSKTQIEKSLRHTATRNQAILDSIPDSLFYFDAQGNLLDYNIVDDDAILNVISTMAADSTPPSKIPEPTANVFKEIKWSVRQTARRRAILDFKFKLPSGLKHQYYEARFTPNGHSEVLVMIRNVTAQKQAEQRLIQTERLAALGQLAAALAHEINNPLQAMQVNLDLVLDFSLDRKEARQTLNTVREEIERLSDVTQRILSYSRPGRTTRQQVRVTNLIDHVLSLANKHIEKKGLDIRPTFSQDPAVIVNPGQMLQVFLNLIINAIEAVPDHNACLEIRVNQEGKEVIIDFINNGTAIDPDLLPYIFEPFFSTKAQGSGLGLWISHTIVQQHGGSLTVDNLPDQQGVRFSVRLPAPRVLK